MNKFKLYFWEFELDNNNENIIYIIEIRSKSVLGYVINYNFNDLFNNLNNLSEEELYDWIIENIKYM